jgi:hypothetical protein
MTSITFAPHEPPLNLDRLRQSSPLMWWTSLAFLAGFAICVILAVADPRLFNGISVWTKPAKFYLSLALHMLTLSFGIAMLPQVVRVAFSTRLAAATMAAMAILEMVYISFRAARAEASHFNISSELAARLYDAMGLGAAMMMVATFWLGAQLLRHGPRNLLGRATGAGFVMAAALTLLVGFTLGAMGSHWIGGDQTDATGLPLFGWSTTGGDLRAAHFAGLHLMQGLPAVALIGSRTAVIAAAVAGLALTLAAYAQALMGLPLVPQ